MNYTTAIAVAIVGSHPNILSWVVTNDLVPFILLAHQQCGQRGCRRCDARACSPPTAALALPSPQQLFVSELCTRVAAPTAWLASSSARAGAGRTEVLCPFSPKALSLIALDTHPLPHPLGPAPALRTRLARGRARLPIIRQGSLLWALCERLK
jgi:hypothetical protein